MKDLGLYKGKKMLGNQPTQDCLEYLKTREVVLSERVTSLENKIFCLEHKPKTFWQLLFTR